MAPSTMNHLNILIILYISTKVNLLVKFIYQIEITRKRQKKQYLKFINECAIEHNWIIFEEFSYTIFDLFNYQTFD